MTGCPELTTDWQCPGRQIKKITVSGQSRASCCLIEYRSISSANILHILSRSRKQIILTSSQNICVALGELFSNPEVNWVICSVDWFLFSLVDRLCQTPASCLQGEELEALLVTSWPTSLGAHLGPLSPGQKLVELTPHHGITGKYVGLVS